MATCNDGGGITMKSSIKGHYSSYNAAYQAIGKRFKENGRWAIVNGGGLDYKRYPWVLIYYGNWV